jgi:hypothetical protein
MVVGFLFIVSLSAGNNKAESGDSLRSGQASRPTHLPPTASTSSSSTASSSSSSSAASAATGTSSSGGGGGWGWGSKASAQVEMEEQVEEEVEKAEDKLEAVAKEQVALHQTTIGAKIATVMQSTRQSLENLLGDSDLVESTDLESLGNQIEDQLRKDVEEYLQDKVAALLEEEDQEMEVEADLETEDMAAENEPDAKEVVEDLEEEKEKLLGDLRKGVDFAANEVLEKMKHMAAKISKKMLETLLEAKTGLTYKVYLDDEDNLADFKKKSSTTSSTTSSTGSKHKSSSKHKSTSSKHKSSSGSTHKSSSHTPSTSIANEDDEGEDDRKA